MPSFDNTAKLALASVLVFIVIGYGATYDATRGVFGKLVSQTDAGSYGQGNTFKQRGFIIHALVFGVIMYLVAKYGLKL